MQDARPTLVSGPGLSFDISRGIPNARRASLGVAVGSDAVLLALLYVFLRPRTAVDLGATPGPGYESLILGVFVALLLGMTAFCFRLSHGQAGEQLILDDLGVRVERGGRILYRFGWTGGKMPLVLGDTRVNQESARMAYETKGYVPPVESTRPDGAFIWAPNTLVGMVRLPDEVYHGVLTEAEQCGWHPIRSVDYYAYGHGDRVYYLRTAFERSSRPDPR